jgi:hypothetical protein
MNVTIKVNPSKALGFLRAMGNDQVPFALGNAVNDTAKAAQSDERLQLRRAFTLRRPEWADRSVKITKFAKKNDPSAVLGIHPPGGDATADIFSKFEADTQKLPKSGTIAIPVSRVGLARGSSGVSVTATAPETLSQAARHSSYARRWAALGKASSYND